MAQPALSICIPTHNRPDLLERALRSALAAAADEPRATEIVVSDNSDDDRTARVAEALLDRWEGPARYVHIPPTGGAVANFNHCVAAASGRFVLILHDDDALLPGASSAIRRAIEAAPPGEPVLLFGVHVVDGDGRVLRRQEFRSDDWLEPPAALRRVLSHSSFVRFPAIVVGADAYAAVGPFDASVGGATDLDMWSRLFARYGVRCVPSTTCTYTVHAEALTTGVFNADTLASVARIFDRVAATRVLSPDALRRCQATFLHQFILGGTVRRLRDRDLEGAREVMRLFALPSVRRLGVSPRWLPVRAALTAATRWSPPGLLARG